jgi:hypothetical protein
MAGIKASQLSLTEKAVLLGVLADLTELRTAFLALTAKLDADGTLAATDFGSTTNPAALLTTEV